MSQENTNEICLKDPFPILPLREIIFFPQTATTLTVSRNESVAAIKYLLETDQRKYVVTVAQKDANQDPTASNLHKIGTLCELKQVVTLSGSYKILISGLFRVAVKLCDKPSENGALLCQVQRLETIVENSDEIAIQIKILEEKVAAYTKIIKHRPSESGFSLEDHGARAPENFVDFVTSNIAADIAVKQEILEQPVLDKRIYRLTTYLGATVETFKLQKRVREKIEETILKQQRAYIERLKEEAFRSEIGDDDDLAKLEKEIKSLPADVKSKAEYELKKLRSLSPSSPEAPMIRSYLDIVISLPYKQSASASIDLLEAEKVLKEEHYGLEDVFKTIIQFLAVQNRTKKSMGKVLCLVGPPGVGKTSVAERIARSIRRKYVRISVGGVTDEAEIRGHRRTYVGSLPGKIINSLRQKPGEKKPLLLLLDEIDKMGSRGRGGSGDPAAALLEVLDPTQNNAFKDHYLDFPFDLSSILFVTTANDESQIPAPLLDRMQIIRLSGYTREEKLEIARRYLLPKKIKEAALKEGEFSIDDETLERLIVSYCHPEAGVRDLDRWITKLCEQTVYLIDSGKETAVHINKDNLETYAGVVKYSIKTKLSEHAIGVLTGLAWTEAGGEIMTIEAVMSPGNGKLQFTGKLGDTMKESVKAAFSYLRSAAVAYNFAPQLIKENDFHVHFPCGGVPKDGPSAGVGITLALLSLLKHKPLRHDFAVTGEISLAGHVLPIGGLKEKIIAAINKGIKTVAIPYENKNSLKEFQHLTEGKIEIVLMKHFSDVVPYAFSQPLEQDSVFISDVKKSNDLETDDEEED